MRTAGFDPGQNPSLGDHSALANLAFEDSGHTGFMRDDGWVVGPAVTATGFDELTMADTAENQAAFVSGRAIRHRPSPAGAWRYAVVTGYAAGVVTFAGQANNPVPFAMVEWSVVPRIVPIHGAVPGRFADAASTTLLASDDLQQITWGDGPAYLVQLSVISGTDDSGASQPHVGVTVGGAQVCTEHGNEGPECVDTGWIDSGVGLSAANYGVAFDDTIEITTDAAGSNDDSTDLSFRLIFVMA